MAKPSLVVLLVEDRRQQQFIFRYFRRAGLGIHAMRVVRSPSGAGSAEQWVRERFAVEVEACRSRRAQTKLVVLIDADTQTVRQRISQLDQTLRDAGAHSISGDTREIARLVPKRNIPKRNIEAWILCLNDVPVNEDADYKTTRDNWTELIGTAADRLYMWSRVNASVPPECIESLRIGILELQKLGL